ncbi:MAG: lanthionine synthetase LanC family protein [Gemmatimonadaceae bacterium]
MCSNRHNEGLLSRRELVGGLAAAAVLAGARSAPAQSAPAVGAERPYLDVALRAERWLTQRAIRREQGVTWAANPDDATSIQNTLYSGSPGVVLFYLELAQATGNKPALETARQGARYLANAIVAPNAAQEFRGERAGLYTGLAGIVYVLERAYRATSEPGLGESARSAATLLTRLAEPARSGVAWSESNDIISGSAGIGLALLWAAKALGTPEAVALAAKAGRNLLEAGLESHGGITWPISPKVPRRYPNFSHGSGGVAYFLATLYAATQDRAFLEGALNGVRYLQAVATDTPNGGKMVFHSEPGNEQLFYLSWCHGPSGTARLFHRLGDVTRDRAWSAYADQLNVATRDMKVPEQSPGFWNNVSQCCGNCGVVEHFLAMYDRTGDSRHLDFARSVADDAIRRATPDGEGLKWVQAEHRVQPANLVAQTGLMQGAAGIGLAMLHVDGAMQKRRPFVVLPDSPYFG